MYYSHIIIPLEGIEDESKAFELHEEIIAAIHSLPNTGSLIEKLDNTVDVGIISEAMINESLKLTNNEESPT